MKNMKVRFGVFVYEPFKSNRKLKIHSKKFVERLQQNVIQGQGREK